MSAEKTFPQSVMVLHAVCPHCGEVAKRLDYLLAMAAKKPYGFGPWACDSCNHYYSGTLSTVDGKPSVITVKSDKSSSEEVYDLLVLPPQNKPVYLIVSTEDYGRKERDQSFYYNEHTCPTNWIKRVVGIVIGDDPDPHGLFEFVGRTYHHEASAENIHHDNDYPFGYEFLSRFYPVLALPKG